MNTQLDSDEFRVLLAALAECEDDSERQHGEARIWARYGVQGVAFVSDMCRFSRTTRSHGICHQCRDVFIARLPEPKRKAEVSR